MTTQSGDLTPAQTMLCYGLERTRTQYYPRRATTFELRSAAVGTVNLCQQHVAGCRVDDPPPRPIPVGRGSMATQPGDPIPAQAMPE